MREAPVPARAHVEAPLRARAGRRRPTDRMVPARAPTCSSAPANSQSRSLLLLFVGVHGARVPVGHAADALPVFPAGLVCLPLPVTPSSYSRTGQAGLGWTDG